MKRNLLFLLTIIFSMSFFGCIPDDNNPLQDGLKIKELPETAQTFIKAHFPDYTVTYIKDDYEDGQLCKEVYLRNGYAKNYKIVFDSENNWIEVEGDDDYHLAVPESIMQLLPEKISIYIKSNYPNAYVSEVAKKYNFYKVEITENRNDLELYFDLDGKFLYIDN